MYWIENHSNVVTNASRLHTSRLDCDFPEIDICALCENMGQMAQIKSTNI